jgi:hypothetical protein
MHEEADHDMELQVSGKAGESSTRQRVHETNADSAAPAQPNGCHKATKKTQKKITNTKKRAQTTALAVAERLGQALDLIAVSSPPKSLYRKAYVQVERWTNVSAPSSFSFRLKN